MTGFIDVNLPIPCLHMTCSEVGKHHPTYLTKHVTMPVMKRSSEEVTEE